MTHYDPLKRISEIPITALNGAGMKVTANLTVVEIRNGTGTTLLLTGGVHGDELEGPVALLNLARTLEPHQISGRLLLVPIANPTAVLASSRQSPCDNLDLNRSFPGNRDGSLTEATAAALMPLVEQADAVFDLHAGGTRYALSPCILVHPLADAALMAQTLAAALAFGAPFCVLIDEGAKSGMFDTEVEQLGKIFGCAELGGFGSLSPSTRDIAERGIRNLIAHFGMGGERASSPTRDILVTLDDSHHAVAPVAGLFEPAVELGDMVECGARMGCIHDLDAPHHAPTPVIAGTDGILFFRHAGGMVDRGQALFITGSPASLAAATRSAAEFHASRRNA